MCKVYSVVNFPAWCVTLSVFVCWNQCYVEVGACLDRFHNRQNKLEFLWDPRLSPSWMAALFCCIKTLGCLRAYRTDCQREAPPERATPLGVGIASMCERFTYACRTISHRQITVHPPSGRRGWKVSWKLTGKRRLRRLFTWPVPLRCRKQEGTGNRGQSALY